MRSRFSDQSAPPFESDVVQHVREYDSVVVASERAELIGEHALRPECWINAIQAAR
jgi:hypothetical protein